MSKKKRCERRAEHAMTDQEARDDREAIFEALADRLGEHPRARNHEIADSGEYETFMHEVHVEGLAEWLMPTVLQIIARKHPEPEWEYEVTYSSTNGPSVDGHRLRGASGILASREAAEQWASVVDSPRMHKRTKAVPPGPWKEIA